MFAGLVLLIAPPSNGALVAAVGNDSDTRGDGAIHIREGLSNTILVADGSAQARCADADGDGVSGVVRLAIGLRDARTGASHTGVIAPLQGDVDEWGRFKARLSFERGGLSGQDFEGWLLTRSSEMQR
jgi:hypothetical protein